MSDAPNRIREVGRKKGDVLERFTKLQRTVMPLSKRTVRKKKVEKFKTLQELNDAGVH
jgi:dynactin complex subunit